eukprot:5002174-Pleurochrysis_carterae.AAC.2
MPADARAAAALLVSDNVARRVRRGDADGGRAVRDARPRARGRLLHHAACNRRAAAGGRGRGEGAQSKGGQGKSCRKGG